MAACPHIDVCALHRHTLADQPAVADIYSRLYCHGRSDVCARFVALGSLGRERVPSSLYPNQLERAARLIRGG